MARALAYYNECIHIIKSYDPDCLDHSMFQLVDTVPQPKRNQARDSRRTLPADSIHDTMRSVLIPLWLARRQRKVFKLSTIVRCVGFPTGPVHTIRERTKI
jgi:hypothetical protein